jgi:hypothetical protein
MTICHSNEHGATDLRVGSTDVINNSFADVINNSFADVINNSFADAVASVQHGNAHHQH